MDGVFDAFWEGSTLRAQNSAVDNDYLLAEAADPEATVDAVEQLRAMEQAVLEGFAFSPAPFGELSAIELRTWDVRFRRSLLALADQFCAVELALLEGKHQEAQTLYRELGKLKKSGHGIFKAD